MKLNWAERWVVNNPLRVFEQRLEIKWFKRVMPLKPGATIVEIGCGRGAGAKLIVKEFRPSLLHILDLDMKMMLKAKKHLFPMPTEHVKLYVGDSINLPFKSGAVDAVFGFGFLHHVPDWRRALSEIARVLKDGGIYYLEELYPTLYQNVVTKHILFHPEHDRFDGRELRTMLDEMNLHLSNAVELPKMGILGVATRSGQ
jgi:ubiquinone/menaquinone biosynthesis C-methylase UbiE